MYFAGMPTALMAGAKRRTLIRSPRDATASSARGVASPNMPMAWHRLHKRRNELADFFLGPCLHAGRGMSFIRSLKLFLAQGLFGLAQGL